MADPFAVTELGGDFHLTGHAGYFLEPVTSHEASVETGTAGDNMYRLDFVEEALAA